MGKENIEDVYRLSPLQQGLLFHSVYSPTAGEYVVQYAYGLRGRLDAAAFERAWCQVVERHPILRTSFHWQGLENWVQVVHRKVSLTVEHLDWSNLAAEDQEHQLETYLRNTRRRGFEPEKPPLMRLMLARTGDRDYRFAWSFHHLLLDGWSLPIVLGDLFRIYSANLYGAPDGLAAITPYRQYITWLKHQNGEAAESYWRRQLAGFETPLELDFGGRAGGATADAPEGMAEHLLGPADTAQLEAFARRQKLTMNSLTQGAWALLLGRLSGRDDVVYGTTVSGRPADLPGVESMVGLFINTLPVRLRLRPETPLVSWLGEVQDRMFELRGYEYSPLPDIQRWSGVPQGTPLFHLILAFENFPHGAGAGIDGLEIHDERVFDSSHYPLAVIVLPGESLVLRARYDTSRFAASDIARLLRHFARLLHNLVEGPEQKLGELEMLSSAERHQLLVEWNGGGQGATEPAAGELLPALFARRAAAAPEALAVCFANSALSYGALEEVSNRLAHLLRTHGAGRGTRVALFLDRSLDAVIAILATLQAGAAYVPLDPSYPEERLSFMFEDSGAVAILSQARRATALPATGLPVIHLDTLGPALGDQPPMAPPVERCAADPAYVIYTSGSTGRPKGVVVSHGQAARLFAATAPWFDFGEEDVWTLFHSTAFDFSVWEVWGALAHGGRLVVVPYATSRSPAAFLELLAAERVSVLNQTPSAFRQLIAAEESTTSSLALHTVIFGGEALELASLRPWFERHGDHPRLVNMYGITETTVHVTGRPLRRSDVERAAGSLIGQAIPDLSLHLLDRRLRPVPQGVAGEICIGGAGVAQRYLDRPALTAERFVADPFGKLLGARIYRSGDLARYRPDGELEYLGRIDHQVKVRGFRIEVGEIETALVRHAEIREAVVLARTDGAEGDVQLVAYAVPASAQKPPTVQSLRTFLAAGLPDYMLPAALMILEELPLTAHGKVDRRALPAPGSERPRLDNELMAPRTTAEDTLAQIWAQVLRLEEVGIHDNFFELGGDSILSLRIVSKASRSGLHITPRQFFEQPTVAALAALAEAAKEGSAEGSAEAIPEESVDGPVPLTAIQRWFFELDLNAPWHFNQALLLAPGKELQTSLLAPALSALCARHDALRLRFERSAGTWRALSTAEEESHLLLHVDLSALPSAARPTTRKSVATQCQGSLDLARGPLLRACLLSDGHRQEERLLLVIHHLAVDGVSWRILLEDLEHAYQQLSHGIPVELPPVAMPWQRWARRLEGAISSAEVSLDTAAWKDLDKTPPPPLPVDLAPAVAREAEARTIDVRLRADETASLLREIPAAAGTQITDLLLTALAEAFSRFTEHPALWIDLEGHGREDVLPGADLSRTVGWFTTLYPVLLDTSQTELPRRLRVVKETLRGLPRHGFDYSAARYLGSDAQGAARLAAGPRPQVSFNYLGQLDRPPEEGSLLTAVWEDIGPLSNRQEQQRYLFEVAVSVVDGCLNIAWNYSTAFYHQATAERLADDFAAALRSTLAFWTRPDAAPCFIAADFPLATLTPHELDLLAQRSARIDDVYPLAPLQEGLLFQTLLQPELDLYVEQLCCVLEGDLEPSLFEQVWQDVVRRHSVLRTAFVWEDFAKPLQVVVRDSRPSLTVEELSQLSAEAQEEQLQTWLRADRKRGFELSAGPPLRLAFLRSAPQRGFFVWTYHHLLLDGWSLSLVLREVFDLYRTRYGRNDLALPATRPYRDYIAWLGQQNRAEAETYWREALAGIDAPTPFGVDRPAPEAADPEAERGQREIQLSVDLSRRLDAFCRHHRLTLNTLLQGVWGLLLQRYGGSTNVVFGTIVAGRPPSLEGAEDMVGLFINALPVQVQIGDGSVELTPWLSALQEQQAELGQYSWCALREIQGLSAVPQGEPLFESLFVFENYPIDASLGNAQGGPGDLTITEVRALARTNYPLALVAGPGEQLWLRLNYEHQRFTTTTVERALQHLATLLAGCAAAPHGHLSELPLLTAAERHQLHVAWNDPAQAEVAHQTIGPTLQHHFEVQAAATPTAAAVISEDRTLNFDQLNSLANQLAHRLRRLGVGPDVCVGIALERCVEMVVGVLGILKAGGAYLPLDPEHPAERLATILGQTPVRAVVTKEALLPTLPATGCELLCLDPNRLANEETTNPLPNADLDNLAYVMYTSGSTGIPKGVMIPHRGVLNRLIFALAAGHLRPGDRFLQKASLGFDVSVLEIFLPLLAGGATVLTRPGGQRDPAYLVRRMVEAEVSQAIFPPSLLRLLLAEDGIHACRSLHSVASSADALPVELQDDFFSKLDADLFNRYGPTETSIAASSWKCVPRSGERSVPIGRPIARARLSVLRALEALPIGAPGELAIAGPGLARGYFGRPGITAEKFIPDPQGDGERLYLTGDLARMRPDGAFEFLGRVDHQLKIGGHRVEPGEIEALLEELGTVREAVVVGREDRPGIARLVAYVVPPPGSQTNATELRRALDARLPPYMVPTAFVELSALPLSPNGKIDRAALPAPAVRPDEELVVPRTSPERVLAAIWADVLQVEQVGAHDNFFALGGDSILSLSVISKAREAGFQITLRQLFEQPTIAELATVAVLARATRADQGALSGSVPLTPIQRRFFDADPIAPHHFNQAVFLLLQKPLEDHLLHRAVNFLLAHHDALRLRFDQGEDGWRQGYAAPGGAVPAHRIDLSALPASHRPAAAEQAAQHVQGSLDLHQGPLLRAVSFDLAPTEPGRLLLVVHHLAIDGVSWRIVLEDLESTLRQLAAGVPPALAAKTFSYRQAAERLATLAAELEPSLDNPTEGGELAPWLAMAQTHIPTIPVDPGADREANTIASAHTLRVTLSGEETEELLRKLPSFYKARVDDLLLTALAEATFRWTGQRQLLVDLESHGREHGFEELDLSRTVGWLTVLYPALLKLDPSPDPGQRLRSIRDGLRNISRRGLPWGLARHGLQSAQLAALPTAEVSFNYLGRLDLSAAASQLFAPAPEQLGGTRSPRAQRRHVLEINGAVVDSQLELAWTFSDKIHRRQTIERLAQDFLTAVRHLIEATRSPAPRSYRPTDFPNINLDQSKLNKILQKVKAR